MKPFIEGAEIEVTKKLFKCDAEARGGQLRSRQGWNSTRMLLVLALLQFDGLHSVSAASKRIRKCNQSATWNCVSLWLCHIAARLYLSPPVLQYSRLVRYSLSAVAQVQYSAEVSKQQPVFSPNSGMGHSGPRLCQRSCSSSTKVENFLLPAAQRACALHTAPVDASLRRPISMLFVRLWERFKLYLGQCQMQTTTLLILLK